MDVYEFRNQNLGRLKVHLQQIYKLSGAKQPKVHKMEHNCVYLYIETISYLILTKKIHMHLLESKMHLCMTILIRVMIGLYAKIKKKREREMDRAVHGIRVRE